MEQANGHPYRGAEYNAMNMDTKYETHQQNVTKTRSRMADNAHLQVRNRVANHGVGDNAVRMDSKYGELVTTDTLTTIDEEFVANTLANYNVELATADALASHDEKLAAAIGLINPTSTTIEMEAKGETKGGLQFLHISDNMARRSETNTVTRRPLMPDAALKKKEGGPKVQVTLCQEDRRDEACTHTYDEESVAVALATYVDTPKSHHDAGTYTDNTYKEETFYDEEFDDANLAIYIEEHVDTIDTLAINNKETAADALDIYDEESATLANCDAIATYDEENAAVERSRGGHN
jgi:hypothetical protein